MKLTIYENSSNINVVNKKLKEIETIDFNFKDNSSIVNPVLLIKKYTKGNYCFIPELKRFYFIQDIELQRGGLYKLSLFIDVLGSYKDSVINSEYYSENGSQVIIPNEVDYSGLVSYDQYILNLGV